MNRSKGGGSRGLEIDNVHLQTGEGGRDFRVEDSTELNWFTQGLRLRREENVGSGGLQG